VYVFSLRQQHISRNYYGLRLWSTTKVSAAEPETNTRNSEAPFNFNALRQASNEMRATFSYKFHYASISDFTPSPTNFLVTFNGWLGNAESLEINLLNADLKIIIHNDSSAFVQSSDWSTALFRHSPLHGISTISSSSVPLAEAIRIARNHIGLPLAHGAGFSTRMLEMDKR